MAGTITLDRTYLKFNQSDICRQVWSISVTATSSIDGLGSKIFVYQAAPTSDPITYDRFSNVASVEDMNLLPEDEPATTTDESYENTISFYRKNTVTLDFYEPDQADRAWRIIKRDVQNLIRNYNASVNLKDSESVDINEHGVVVDLTPVVEETEE